MRAAKAKTSYGQIIPLVTGGFCTVLGLVLIVAWHTNTTGLLQIISHTAPVRYNTAIAFVLSGLALLALIRSWPRWAGVFSLFATLIGGLTLAQYIFNVDFGIDELLMHDYLTQNLYTSDSAPLHLRQIQQFFITVQHPVPGRSSPNTSLGLTFVGIALLCLSLPERSKYTRKLAKPLAGIFGAGVIGLGTTAIIGYLVPVTTAYVWRYSRSGCSEVQ